MMDFICNINECGALHVLQCMFVFVDVYLYMLAYVGACWSSWFILVYSNGGYYCT